MKKRLLTALAIFHIFLICGGLIYASGLLVRPTEARMGQYIQVQSRDLLIEQAKIEQEIISDYQGAKYTLQAPYILQDPYQANPLSALVIFETDRPARTEVTVKGKNDLASLRTSNDDFSIHHEVAVLGLYPAVENTVSIKAIMEDGSQQETVLRVVTEGLPVDFPSKKVEEAKPELMEPGVTLMIACFETSYTYLLDAYGDVRGYFSNKFFAHGTAMRVLKNGRLVAAGDVMKLMPYNMYTLWELDFLGKVYTEYEIPNAVHHEVIELENGDFLATSNHTDAPISHNTREDMIIQINRVSGEVVKEYDLAKVLDKTRKPYHHFDTGILNQPSNDWAHLNSVEVDGRDGMIITSSPIQSAVVKFDPLTYAIKWMLSSPEGWDGAYDRFRKYLLTPVGGGEFEWSWGQHAAKLLPDGDGNADTIDLIVFDNGQARSFLEETSLAPDKNYSRAVIYRINEKRMTVEQLWQYGKKRGSDAYATFLGSADYLKGNDNILIAFGGMLRQNDAPVDSIVAGVLGEQNVESRVTEVAPTGQVVFDVHITPNNATAAETYQARRIDLSRVSTQVALGKQPGKRLGTVQSSPMTVLNLPKIFLDKMDFQFTQIFNKDGYLILHGNFKFEGKTYTIGRVNFILKSQKREYIFEGSPAFNGNLYARLSLKDIDPGEYAIYGAGAVIEGMDANGKPKPAYNPTGYKIRVP